MRTKFKARRMRAAYAMSAGLLLAVPASAYALTAASTSTAAAPQSALPMTVSDRQIAYGEAVHVDGTAPGATPGTRVTVEVQPARTSVWKRLATTSVQQAGRFHARVALRHSGVLRAVLSSAPPTAVAARHATAGAAARPRSIAVKVAAVVRTPSREHAVLAGHKVTVAGHLLPARAGRTVRLQGHSAAGWRTLSAGHTGSRGGFALHYAPGSTGLDRHLRVLFGGDAGNTRAVHGAGSVTSYEQSVASWYDDGGSTACGFHSGLGVANKSLPCGTKVRFRFGGRSVTATVDDRGPYVGGRDWDLNQTTAAALGFGGVGTVWASS